jgi:EmrB/QacA subfamily drug resistance transporter
MDRMSTGAAAVRPASRLAALTSVVIAMLVSSMDSTITNTTMPKIAEELGGMGFYAWTFTSYMIFCTVLTPIAGRISDLFGRRLVFSVGLIVFMTGSLLCGLADSMPMLVLYRAVQGIGAGLITPFPMIIAGDLYPVEKRGKIQALFTGMWGLSAVLAPLVGSLFVETVGWRWIFWINIPLCLVSCALLFAYKEVYEPKKAAVDVSGAVLFTIGVSLLLSVTVVERMPYLVAACGLLFIVWFVLFERKHPSPIVPLALFAIRPIRWMAVNILIACTALFGTSSFVPLFLQHEGYSIFVSGLSLLGMSAGWMLSAVPAGKWVLKYGYTRQIIIGNAILVASGLLLMFLREGTGFAYVTFAMFVQGVAYGLLFTVTTIGAQQFVGPHDKGVSTSLQMFVRNIGTSVGVTIMGGLLNRAGDDVMGGIANLFLFGAAMSVVALLSAFGMRDPKEIPKG